jgi:putative ABC transport system permease protein
VPRGQEPRANEIAVSPDYFRVLRVPLVAGRMLSSHDNQDAPPVVVVNQAFARQFFPGENAVGHRVSLSVDAPLWQEIVGIVGDIRQGGLDQDASPTYYFSFRQQKMALFGRTGLLLRTAGDPRAAISASQKMTAAVDPDEPLFDVKTLEQRLDESIGSPRFRAALVGSFAAIAAMLAAIGVYGVMSYLVTLRTSEIGIRLALGARGGQVLGMIMREGLALGLLGAALGVAGALGLSRYLAALLYGVGTRDLETFCIASAALLSAVLAACIIPGRRAAQIDAAAALRHE